MTLREIEEISIAHTGSFDNGSLLINLSLPRVNYPLIPISSS